MINIDTSFFILRANHKRFRCTAIRMIKKALALSLLLMLVLLTSCGNGGKKRYVIGVSQCSEDTWREKMNDELRTAASYYNADLHIRSANDDVRLQTEQINKFVDEKVDLLIVAPGQVTISPAIDRAYEQGIPVIVLDRRTRSNKYTAHIGADNRAIGTAMAEYLASALGSDARIVELRGLSTSSPAIERSEGFDSVMHHHPNVAVVAHPQADWTEQGAYRVVDSLLSHPYTPFNCLFAHNDRMAMGARKACAKHGLDVSKIRFCGIDGMPQKDGGMQLVADGQLFASFIYPTRGDEVLRLAMNILEGKPFERENQLSSALVNADNARVLLMQNDETVRQRDHLTTLRSRIDKAAADVHVQQTYLLVLLLVVVLLVVACAYAVRGYFLKASMNRQLKDSVEQQRRMTEHMAEMTQTQLQFFTNVSHELRTPLTLIAGPTDQLLSDPTLVGRRREQLLMVQRNTKVLIQLVGEILDFRKVQNNKAELKLNRFCPVENIALWANDFKTVAQGKGIEIKLDQTGLTSTDFIVADREKLEHVFINLMSNAMKYTPNGGRITIVHVHKNNQFTLSINNTGKAIPAADLPHLFERFYQAKGSAGGTGIGLALVKAYIDLHHGEATVESNEQEGTTFTVSVPDTQPGYDPAADVATDAAQDVPTHIDANLVDDSHTPEAVVAAEKADRITHAEDFDADRPLVLVIDDNSGMRAYLRSVLEEKYNVTEAVDGQQGLERARREVPKLVVCDVMMPVMDGLEFTRRLKADTATSHIPVILLTARTLGEQREEGYGSGADSYLTKPFSGSVLLARIDNLLRSRTLLRSLFAGDKKEEEEEGLLNVQDQTFVSKLRDVIRCNMSDSDFSVERIGEVIGLSRVQLYRKVKALTGQTPVELLRKARLEKARQMIMHTERSVAEIAYEVGFTSPSYFNKCFKDEFGVSPGGLREGSLSTADRA